MDKELAEAVEILNKMKRTYDIKAPNINVRSQAEIRVKAIDTVLNYIDNSIPKDKINEVLNDLNSEYIEIEKDFDAIYKKENKDMQEFYTTRDLTTQLQMISWFEGILEEVLEED